jgi:Raf kinase inhibitor-like YbhB/YbcL family protein
MQLTSPAFQHKGHIPKLYTCEGKNAHPPLQFHNIPEGTKSFVLIMDDPDVPASIRPEQMFDHWVIFNIPPETREIKESGKVPGIQGQNTRGKNDYFGPCPPFGEHRYFFKLYALDCQLLLHPGATKKAVQQALQGHVLAEAELMGLYAKTGAKD